jgi:U3 small nucleolar RNA-associated protein 14
VKKIKEALSGDEDSDEDENVEDSSEGSDDEVKMEFAKKMESKKAKKEATGIMNMKFMKTADANKKERLKNEAKMLVDQIENDKEVGSDDNDGGLFGGASKFGGGMSSKFAEKAGSKAPVIDTEEVLRAAQQIFENQKRNPVQEIQ